MRILNPLMLAWAVALVLPILLYLFRRKPKELRVSTLPFFKALAREHQEAEWLRRLKRLLSFLMTAAVILLAVGTLAQIVFSKSEAGLRSVVILVDRSASMGAKDAAGQSRLELAVSKAKYRLAGLGEGTSVAVVAYDHRAEVVLSRSHNRRSVVRALDGLAVRSIEGDASRGLALARRIAAVEAPSAIWHFTDALASAEPTTEPTMRVETTSLALEAPVNVGLTAFALRPSPMSIDEYEAFVQVQAVSPEPMEVELEVRLDDDLVTLRSFTLEPGSAERLLIPLAATGRRVLSLQVKAEGDVLAADDTLFAWIPEPQPTRITWVTPKASPFTQLCLTTLGDDRMYSVYRVAPEAWSADMVTDLVIFDGWLPGELPGKAPLIVIDPPTTYGALDVARLANSLPTPGVRSILDEHPVNYAIATDRLAVMQTAVIGGSSPLTPIWRGVAGPLLAAGDMDGRRIVLMAFAPDKSSRLPLLTAWPVLMGNAILWATDPEQQRRLARHEPTGSVVEAPDGVVTILSPQLGQTASREVVTGRRVELTQNCLWMADSVNRGSASLLSREETLLSARPAPPDAEADLAETQASASVPFAGEWLLWLALAVLVLEHILFHKFAVY